MPVVFTLANEEETEPVATLDLPAPERPGLQSVALDKYGLTLRAGPTYVWSIALVPDRQKRSKDVVTQAGVIRRARESDIAADSDQVRRAVNLAGEGLWYDSLELLVPLAERSPAAAQTLIALLEQVGLPEVAAHERRLLSSSPR